MGISKPFPAAPEQMLKVFSPVEMPKTIFTDKRLPQQVQDVWQLWMQKDTLLQKNLLNLM
jgi:hypothetical protein